MLRHGDPVSVAGSFQAGSFQKSMTLQMMLDDSPGLALSKKKKVRYSRMRIPLLPTYTSDKLGRLRIMSM